MIQKAEWRKKLLEIRKAIPDARRKEASHKIKDLLHVSGNILSFSSIGSEIDLTPLNEILKNEGRLFLVPYKIDSLIEVPLAEIDCILVPGLGFDREMTRLGYGKGHYDRFLASIGNVLTIGVGFKEQLCQDLLPKESWDIPVKKLMLV